MRILLLGASGETGLPTLAEALARKHTVIALVRRPEVIPEQQGLTIVKGTPELKSDIAKSFDVAPASDPVRVVVSALNNGRTTDIYVPWAKPRAPVNFMEECARNCISEMKKRGCTKLVWLGTNGVGDSTESVAWILRWFVAHSSLQIIFTDHYKTQLVMEEAARKDSNFKWVSVRAGGLRHGLKQELKFYGNDGKGYPTIGKISRASVASFMIDCVESDQWDGQTPVITN